jgi:hypothetical protein
MNPDEKSIMFDINKVGEQLSYNLDELDNKLDFFSHEIFLEDEEPRSPPDVKKRMLNEELIPIVDRTIDLLEPFAETPIPEWVEIKGQKNPDFDGDAYRCFIAGIKVGNLLPELNAIKELKDVSADELSQYNLPSFAYDVGVDIYKIKKDLSRCRIFKEYIKDEK